MYVYVVGEEESLRLLRARVRLLEALVGFRGGGEGEEGGRGVVVASCVLLQRLARRRRSARSAAGAKIVRAASSFLRRSSAALRIQRWWRAMHVLLPRSGVRALVWKCAVLQRLNAALIHRRATRSSA